MTYRVLLRLAIPAVLALGLLLGCLDWGPPNGFSDAEPDGSAACEGEDCALHLTGSFTVGSFDRDIGARKLQGNLGYARRELGRRCVGTTCITGGISP